MVELVNQMLTLNERRESGRLAPSEIDRIDRVIASTDKEIDNLVYDLYDLSETERTSLAD
jgi:hypothetical protein